MRSLMLVVAGLALVAGVVVFASSLAAEAEKAEPDPFVGSYLKFGRWKPRKGQFGEVPSITITKAGDTYQLSRPYDTWKFKPVEKGVISDGKGGLGSIYAGKTQFVDGFRVRTLRAEFCYEHFILYDSGEGYDLKQPAKEEKK